MRKPVLEEVPYLLAVCPDFEGTDTHIKDSSPVGIGVVAVGADGIGFSTISFGVFKSLAYVMIHAWVAGIDVDAHRKGTKPESCGCAPVTVAVIGSRDARNVFAEIEHIVVLVSEITQISA